MKKRYFRYSRSSESGKYTEITKDEYIRLKETGQHFFICLEGCFFECCREEYDDYFREMNHAYNTRRDKNGRRITPSSYDKLTDNGRFECMLAKDPTIPSLEQAVEERLYAEWEIKALHTAMEKLKPHEKELIHKHFWECTDEKTIAAEQHITQQAVNKKLHRILCKLLKLMNCKK